MASAKHRILHVDDEEDFRIQVCQLLTGEGYEVDLVASGIEAMNILQKATFDLVLLDLNMPKVDGMEVLAFIKEKYPSTQVIMLTGVDDVRQAVDCMKRGAFHYIPKPIRLDELLLGIRRGLEHHDLVIENSAMRSELSRISGDLTLIGSSKSFNDVIAIAGKVAPTDSSILIQGASGTGKEMVANYIYKHSSRADRPFVAINCASIPDTLIESELFGYEQGAFTDARGQKQGIIELAHNGTLFLDEIGDLSIVVQPKLLRFIQAGEFRRVGGNAIIKADVRVISASNKDLREAVSRGKFREDLLYRLNVITLVIPNLRDRKDDIPSLVENFISRKLRMKTRKQLSPEAMRVLMSYDWPGNIRELENVLESACILSRNDIIQPEDLTLPQTAKFYTGSQDGGIGIIGSPLPMDEIEKLHIAGLLSTLNWDKKLVSKTLGISLKTLYTKISEYQLRQE